MMITKFIVINKLAYKCIKTDIFFQPDPKVHLGRAWRIEFSYRNIHEYLELSKGRARPAAARARTFDRS
jgi:hypothetical protein